MGDWFDVGDFSFSDTSDFGDWGDWGGGFGDFSGALDSGFSDWGGDWGTIGGGDSFSSLLNDTAFPDWVSNPSLASFEDPMGLGASIGPDWATQYDTTYGGGLNVLGENMQAPGAGYSFGGIGGGWDPTLQGFNYVPSGELNLTQFLGPAAQIGAAGVGAAAGGGGATAGGTGGAGTPVRFPTPTAQPAAQPGLLQSLLSPQGLAGIGGLAAGVGGALAGGGVTGTSRQETMPALIPERASIGPQANAAWTGMQPWAQGQMPLQQMQMSLLDALQSGRGLPAGYQQLVEQAYQPMMGDIASQAIESARRRGFAGGAGLLQEGPAGAIAGPALASLQGQMAQSKLGLMQTLPGLFNAPIQTQGGFQNMMGQGLNQLGASYPSGQQTQGQTGAPLGPQIGGMLSNALTGFGTALGQQQQQQQQQNMLSQFFGGGGGATPGTGASGSSPVGGMSYWGV